MCACDAIDLPSDDIGPTFGASSTQCARAVLKRPAPKLAKSHERKVHVKPPSSKRKKNSLAGSASSLPYPGQKDLELPPDILGMIGVWTTCFCLVGPLLILVAPSLELDDTWLAYDSDRSRVAARKIESQVTMLMFNAPCGKCV